MELYVFPSGPFSTNAYLLGFPETGIACLIDPAPDCFDDVCHVLNTKKWMLKKILLTHSHWDHFGDLAKFKSKFNVLVAVHPADKGNLIKPGSDGLPCFIAMQAVVPDDDLIDGQVIDIESTKWLVIHTPGHSPGSICLYCKEAGILISGDTLFKGSIGNLSFPTSNPDAMWPSLKKLEALPKETIFYPGHGEHSTIGAESWLKDAEKIFKIN
ncbi:MAG: MBL fold metallo-hydrolase [Parachlamydiales bacterium]|nr:MBL fold metallo-hydrolase [Parachlamydiales bacterium]